MTNKFTIDEVRTFWDQAAAGYDQINDRIGSAHYQRFSEAIKYFNFNKNDQVLNIWSRTGNAINFLKSQNELALYNLEVSPKMIALAEKKFPHETFQLTDLKKLDFPDNFFDAILSLETLEHAPDPKILINELYRILKPGQKLVMSLPPQTAEIPLKLYELFFKNHGEGPHRFLSSKTVTKMLTDSGFKMLFHKGTVLIPVGPSFLKKAGEYLIDNFPQIFGELGIRQFYVCKKPN